MTGWLAFEDDVWRGWWFQTFPPSYGWNAETQKPGVEGQ
jgi:hypothetical protein